MMPFAVVVVVVVVVVLPTVAGLHMKRVTLTSLL